MQIRQFFFILSGILKELLAYATFITPISPYLIKLCWLGEIISRGSTVTASSKATVTDFEESEYWEVIREKDDGEVE